ncbi:MAG: hypothetical protein CSA55_01075 [Ilumatobacter coccineus]|uniref:Type II secretion system protein GspF domain-containing protein n=1 Tax=Ilumatobacter coccineus TaxID=467094 RepID=A0A2G6KFF2_9ACTN|nr:MAG: hypothetical protein CSA55_01075 [Ilumatobacter coccineus]
MSPTALLILSTLVGVVGALMAIGAFLQPAPTLQRVIRYLERTIQPVDTARWSGVRRFIPSLTRLARQIPGAIPSSSDLAVLGMTAESYAVTLVAASVAGFVGPSLLFAAMTYLGLIGLGWYVPVVGAIAGAILGPLLVHLASADKVTRTRSDLRYQVSAYLDVVTMLLAGNTGYEGALEQAAHAGDGRLFAALRRRMRESGTRGKSLTDALHMTGVDFGIDELTQVAATAALSAAEGAPVALTLAAKCATLRSSLSSEQEAQARLQTSRLTTPIVGMALIFMALVMYPALNVF